MKRMMMVWVTVLCLSVLLFLLPAYAETPFSDGQQLPNMEYFVETPEPAARPTVNPDLQAEYEHMLVLYEANGRMDEYEEVMAELEVNGYLAPLLCEIIGDESHAGTLSINKGTEDGICPGMLVVYRSALIGIISEVETNSATIQTILQPGFTIIGAIQNRRDQTGRQLDGEVSVTAGSADEDFLQMTVSAESIDFTDETVVTSNNGPAVAGIPIGKVCRAIPDEEGRLESVTIEPYADFEWLPYVIVLRIMPEPHQMPTIIPLEGEE